MKRLTLLSALLLCGCVSVPYESGSSVTSKLGGAINSASTNAQAVYKSGAKPKDPKVKAIVTDLKVAQGQVVIITKRVDVQNKALATDTTTIKAKNKRIFYDDIFFGVLALIILAPIAMKILPLLAI